MRVSTATVVMLMLVASAAGCASRRPDYFPATPTATHVGDDGSRVSEYDSDGDGRVDAIEVRDTGGRVREMRYDGDGDGQFEQSVAWGQALAEHRAADPAYSPRHLLIIVDSVPFEMVRDLWDHGRFRLFFPPGRTISPFPVMTDPALAEFYHVGPIPGVEAVHFDGAALTGGMGNYVDAANMPWLAQMDYSLPTRLHGPAYLWPMAWFDDELARIETGLHSSDKALFTGYMVTGSGIGSKLGRDGHQAGLIRLDRFCQRLIHESRGTLQITLMSDHGHNLVPSRRVEIERELTRAGYRVSAALESPRDVVVPAWGLVSCVALHTRSAAKVARDCVGLAGVEHTAYVDESGAVVVLDRRGEARIEQRDGAYRYTAVRGDPLNMLAIVDRLAGGAADRFIADADLLRASAYHEYPDAVQRLWRAFHGLLQHAPDVFLSLEDGAYHGSAGIDAWIDMQSVHGNLRSGGSCGFVMTTAGPVPPVQRIADSAAVLRALGVPIAAVSSGD